MTDFVDGGGNGIGFRSTDGHPGNSMVTMNCLRCQHQLDYMGSRNFHEGSRWGMFGALGELFVNNETFDVYVCSHCGHVELLVSGTGKDLEQE
jgi:hypothetical protein